MLSVDPADAMLRTDPKEQMLQIDPREPSDAKLPQDTMLAIDKKLNALPRQRNEL
tara:strand:+ start:144 stop:308 length:165 start_codon:yes stop_codon:yes gene_type:complete